ncbi:mitochondrial import receptor subunit TOM7 homolog [Paramuricea clavata]|uniref:Mitochondrial import receptor subunit TOM7 homolog n=1 Tax=Paramuricea clavata TaxID=317549 RepID=A0A6S7FJ32_PARCT|nr:mitochondrial import receptor subunit TOM7 homolog [Paramuricea clavata]
MVGWNKETKKRIQVVLSGAKTSFYYGFIPVIIYLGLKKGADQGMPEPTILSLLWA